MLYEIENMSFDEKFKCWELKVSVEFLSSAARGTVTLERWNGEWDVDWNTNWFCGGCIGKGQERPVFRDEGLWPEIDAMIWEGLMEHTNDFIAAIESEVHC